MSANWVARVCRQHPHIVYAESLWWDGNILIDDVRLDQLGLEGEIPPLKVPLLTLTAVELTERLGRIYPIRQEYSGCTFLPGMGAKGMRQYLGLGGGVVVSAQRLTADGSKVQIERFLPPVPNYPVRVFDDVVCSGLTAETVCQVGQFVNPDLITWILHAPRDDRLRVYGRVYAGFLVGGRQRPPTWTMSTFLRYPQRLDTYATQYAVDADDFIAFWRLVAEAQAEFCASYH